MASSSNLDNFLTNLENLPIQIRENLTLMQNVDSRQQNLIHDINKQTENYIKKKGFLKDKKKEKINSIQRQFVKAKEYGDDKVQLALQTYALVDEQIKKLDAQLALFNAKNQEKTPNTIRNIKRSSQKKNFNKNENDEIKKKQLEKGGKKTSAASGKTLLVSSVNISTNFPKNRVTGVQVGTGVARPAEVIDMPIDPNEPKFCLCNQVSFGEMIGCDNSDCPIEWFHFVCVKLITKPKGKWFCPKCNETVEKQ